MRFQAGSRAASWALSKIRSKYALDAHALKGADGAKVSHEDSFGTRKLSKDSGRNRWHVPS
jgi:hypothetical protein